MVETDAAISRLQSTLLRLPKDDLIKLLKSTYQAMRIKHGIPYERAESRAATSAAQRDLRGKSTKSQGVSQGKRKHSTARKKATDGAPDAGSFGKVEQPTFRQVESLTEDLSNLNLSSISYDSDLPETSAEPGRCESSPIPCAAPTPEDVMNDREFAIQTLKDEAKQLVPPLDFSTIDTSAKEAYKFSDFIKPSYSDTQDAHVNRVESAVPDAYSAVRGSGRAAHGAAPDGGPGFLHSDSATGNLGAGIPRAAVFISTGHHLPRASVQTRRRRSNRVPGLKADGTACPFSGPRPFSAAALRPPYFAQVAVLKICPIISERMCDPWDVDGGLLAKIEEYLQSSGIVCRDMHINSVDPESLLARHKRARVLDSPAESVADSDGDESGSSGGDAEGVYQPECVICSEALAELSEVGVPINCLHIFCYTCIKEWSNRTNVCPICKVEFRELRRLRWQQVCVFIASLSRSKASRVGESGSPRFKNFRKLKSVLSKCLLSIPSEREKISPKTLSAETDESLGGCEVCGVDNEWDQLLLCDGCNLGFHLYCLDPPLVCIPRGDWYCKTCVEVRNSQRDSSPSELLSQGGDGYGVGLGMSPATPLLRSARASGIVPNRRLHYINTRPMYDVPSTGLRDTRPLMPAYASGTDGVEAGRVDSFDEAAEGARVTHVSGVILSLDDTLLSLDDNAHEQPYESARGSVCLMPPSSAPRPNGSGAHVFSSSPEGVHSVNPNDGSAGPPLISGIRNGVHTSRRSTVVVGGSMSTTAAALAFQSGGVASASRSQVVEFGTPRPVGTPSRCVRTVGSPGTQSADPNFGAFAFDANSLPPQGSQSRSGSQGYSQSQSRCQNQRQRPNQSPNQGHSENQSHVQSQVQCPGQSERLNQEQCQRPNSFDPSSILGDMTKEEIDELFDDKPEPPTSFIYRYRAMLERDGRNGLHSRRNPRIQGSTLRYIF
ncbi:PHD-finger domain-containing protein [Babesia caballi]|uniref:PHD-finger domain-containing protein n=1 Tax=Babesia caballi TaxID=5871 RepID=A0AAV4M0Z1_BABCB|nr:PHD-finger domain-containing protein [Babesia caballi]